MCGIAGVLRKDGADIGESDLSTLRRMTGAIHHRGPDGEGFWHEGPVAFGHRRLSILDLSPLGAQPMASADGRFVLTYNGEIYNFEDLGQDLRRATGISLRSSSDTEVLLESIAHWGIEKTLPRLNGMFAFAVYDRRDKMLHLARDPMGIKPLFLARLDDAIAFASELKSLLLHPALEKTVDEDALASYFAHTYIPHPKTAYRNIARLEQGTWCSISLSGEKRHTGFGMEPGEDFTDLPSLPVPERAQRFLGCMKAAVRRHRRADVPVSVFLSGGNDSALVAALLAEDGGDFKTFSVGYADPAFDESARARAIADHLSLPHETVMIGPDDAAPLLDRISGMFDEPFADSSCIPVHLLSRHVAEYGKVSLTGDGADELFAGYPRYAHAASLWRGLAVMPAPLRRAVSSLIPQTPPAPVLALLRPFLRQPAKSLPYLKSVLAEQNVLTHFHAANDIGVPSSCLLNPDARIAAIATLAATTPLKGDPLRTLLTFDQRYRLADAMLTKVDRASMAASLEVRTPFLDHSIVSFSRALSPAALAGGEMKAIIKTALRGYLPTSLVDAPKTGFHIPLKRWMRTHFSGWFKDALFLGAQDEYLAREALQTLWARYNGGEDDNLFYPLWAAAMFRQWWIRQ